WWALRASYISSDWSLAVFRLGTFALLASLAVAARAEDPATLISQATTAYQAGDYAKSARLNEAAVSAGATSSAPRYNAACCHALLGKADSAFVWLDKALDAGWRNVDHLKADGDFKSLHVDPRWKRVVQRCHEELDKFLKSLKAPSLRAELLKRMREDQRIRTTPSPNMREWRRIDADNTAFMKSVIEKHGWPCKSLVGADGAQAAFLLVQHAAADPDFQKTCLKLLTIAVKHKEASAAHMAYLTDRVLVMDGKPQRYGTQFHTVDGESKPLPIEDEPNVDARRNEVGLPPLEDYAKQMRDSRRP
ncbi:MAG: DUF6624 domain-containing protein, partial [Phycisphaerae bacterium]